MLVDKSNNLVKQPSISTVIWIQNYKSNKSVNVE